MKIEEIYSCDSWSDDDEDLPLKWKLEEKAFEVERQRLERLAKRKQQELLENVSHLQVWSLRLLSTHSLCFPLKHEILLLVASLDPSKLVGLLDTASTYADILESLLNEEGGEVHSSIKDRLNLTDEEATTLSDLVVKLKKVKAQIRLDFQHLCAPNIRQRSDCPSKGILCEPQLFTSLRLSFFPDLHTQLPTDLNLDQRAFLASGYSHLCQEKVTVKLSANVSNLEREFELLRDLYDEEGKQVVKVLSTSVELIDTVTTSDGTCYSLYGLVMERVKEDMATHLRDRKVFQPYHHIDLAFKVAQLVSFLHSRNKVWMHLKLSNVIVFRGRRAECRVMNLAGMVGCGEQVDTDEDFDPVYAAPEVVRALKTDQTLTAHPRMDMWSLGVCLMEIVSHKTLLELLGMTEKEELESLYMRADFETAVSARMKTMIETTFTSSHSEHFRRMLDALMVTKASERTLTAEDILFDDSFACSDTAKSYLIDTFEAMIEARLDPAVIRNMAELCQKRSTRMLGHQRHRIELLTCRFHREVEMEEAKRDEESA